MDGFVQGPLRHRGPSPFDRFMVAASFATVAWIVFTG